MEYEAEGVNTVDGIINICRVILEQPNFRSSSGLYLEHRRCGYGWKREGFILMIL